jgi:hypothetical protein
MVINSLDFVRREKRLDQQAFFARDNPGTLC